MYLDTKAYIRGLYKKIEYIGIYNAISSEFGQESNIPVSNVNRSLYCFTPVPPNKRACFPELSRHIECPHLGSGIFPDTVCRRVSISSGNPDADDDDEPGERLL